MNRWWLVAAAAALVAVWWLRRGQAALAGTARTTTAPATGNSPQGVQAAIETAGKYSVPFEAHMTVAQKSSLAPKATLAPVGLGTVAPNLGTVPAEKPQPPAAVQPPKTLPAPPKATATASWGWRVV